MVASARSRRNASSITSCGGPRRTSTLSRDQAMGACSPRTQAPSSVTALTSGRRTEMSQTTKDLRDQTTFELEESIRAGHCQLALLPTGAIEQHGPYLPLDTDSFIAERL